MLHSMTAVANNAYPGSRRRSQRTKMKMPTVNVAMLTVAGPSVWTNSTARARSRSACASPAKTGPSPATSGRFERT